MADQQSQQNQQPPLATKSTNPFDKLDEMHQLAVEMRLKWIPYKLIVETILNNHQKPYKEQTIRTWFIEGGECYEAYEYIRKQRKASIDRDLLEAQEKLRESSLEAIGILREGLSNNNITENQLSTAKDILDRTGFPKQTKVESSGKIESDSMDKIAEALKEIADTKVALPKPQ